MEILQLLIAQGAELDIGDENELTSLLIAAQKGIVDILVSPIVIIKIIPRVNLKFRLKSLAS